MFQSLIGIYTSDDVKKYCFPKASIAEDAFGVGVVMTYSICLYIMGKCCTPKVELPMLNQNDPNQLAYLIAQNQADQLRNAMRDRQLSEQSRRIGQLEELCQVLLTIVNNIQAQAQKSEESINYAVAQVRHLTHLIDRKELLEWECQESRYSPDGTPNCNFKQSED